MLAVLSVLVSRSSGKLRSAGRKLGESSPLGRCYAVSIICSIIRTRTPLECVVLARQPGEV